MEVLIIGCIVLLTGYISFRAKEQMLERQQRFYEVIFGRRLNYININTYIVFFIIWELFGLFSIIVGVKSILK